ncbi:MAG TPA: ion transporter [Anaeromyxobacteraceae bacterium]|nr:ion transporter [Anaeromyxobacteraceae bacterium]
MTQTALREKAAEVIFGHHTRAGRLYDLALIAAILLSVLVVMLDSVAAVQEAWGMQLRTAEWLFTGLFTVEYLARLWCTPARVRYVASFYGLVDLVSVLPTYASLLLGSTHALLTIRSLRLLRIFRVLKLFEYSSEATVLRQALSRSRRKITVFVAAVLTLVLILGSLMYIVEGPGHGFTSIPRSVYWAIVTLTTVGYGDITPHTVFGQMLASAVMILGYGIIAVPTGVVTVELSRGVRGSPARGCPRCGLAGHEEDARYCRRCSEALS